jgi:hypothetical protein
MLFNYNIILLDLVDSFSYIRIMLCFGNWMATSSAGRIQIFFFVYDDKADSGSETWYNL